MSSESGIQLIVGLGNPGAQYADTRHNAGAWFVEALAEKAHAHLRPETKFRGAHGMAHIDGHDCHLLLPTTYMNHSGMSVQAVANFYKIPPQAILIAHDEIDLPVGVVRLKYEGGHGGHNGLRHIIEQLNSKQFYRLRIGVGRPTHKEVIDYVLEAPSRSEYKQIIDSLEKVYSVLPLLLKGQFQRAMHLLHTTE